MIDIVRDYVSIGMGGAQAVTAEVAGFGRAGANQVAAHLGAAGGMLGGVRTEGESVLAVGRGLLDGVRRADLDAVASRLGLAKKSEVHAVRQQIQRLERRLGEVRRER